jgi:hypothetical protein
MRGGVGGRGWVVGADREHTRQSLLAIIPAVCCGGLYQCGCIDKAQTCIID